MFKKIFVLMLFLFPFLSKAENSCVGYFSKTQALALSYLPLVFPNENSFDLYDKTSVRELVERISSVLDDKPNDINALYSYWYVSSRLSKLNLTLRNKRLEVAARIVKSEGANERTLKLLLTASRALHHWGHVNTLAKELIKLKPTEVLYQYDLAESYYHESKFFMAEMVIVKVLDQHPNNTKYLNLLAQIYTQMTKSDPQNKLNHLYSAETVYKKIIVLGGPSTDTNIRLAYILLRQKKYQEVLDFFKFSDLDMNYSQYKVISFYAYIGLRNLLEAERIVEELLFLNPTSVTFLNLKRIFSNVTKRSYIQNDFSADMATEESYEEYQGLNNY